MSNNTATIKTRKNLVSTRTITMTALLAAISYVLAFLEFPVPLSPSFGEFLPFIKEELRSRKLQRVKYYNATKLPPEQHNLCYEREGIDRQDKRGYCGTCI